MQHPRYPLGTHRAEILPLFPPAARLHQPLSLWAGPATTRKGDTSVVDVTVVVSDDSFQENNIPEGAVGTMTLHDAHAQPISTPAVRRGAMTPYEKALLDCGAALLPPHLTTQEAETKRKALTLERRKAIVLKYTRPLGPPPPGPPQPLAASHHAVALNLGTVRGASGKRNVMPTPSTLTPRTATVATTAPRSITPPATASTPRDEIVVNAALRSRPRGRSRANHQQQPPITTIPLSVVVTPEDAPLALIHPSDLALSAPTPARSPQQRTSTVDRETSMDRDGPQQTVDVGCSSSPPVLMEPNHIQLTRSHHRNRSVSPVRTISLNVSTTASRVNSRGTSPVGVGWGGMPRHDSPKGLSAGAALLIRQFEPPRPLRQRQETNVLTRWWEQVSASSGAVRCDVRSHHNALTEAFVASTLPAPRPCFSSDYVLSQAARDGEIAALNAIRQPRHTSESPTMRAPDIVYSSIAKTLALATHLIPRSVLLAASQADTKRLCFSLWQQAARDRKALRHQMQHSVSNTFQRWYRATVAARLDRFAADVHKVSLLRRMHSARVVPRGMASSFHRFCTLRRLWQEWKKRFYICSSSHRSHSMATRRAESVESPMRELSPLPLPPAGLSTAGSHPKTTRIGSLSVPTTAAASTEQQTSDLDETLSPNFISDMLLRHSADSVEHFNGYPLLLAARQHKAAVIGLMARYWRSWLVVGRRASYRKDLYAIAVRSNRSNTLLSVWRRWCQRSFRQRTKAVNASLTTRVITTSVSATTKAVPSRRSSHPVATIVPPTVLQHNTQVTTAALRGPDNEIAEVLAGINAMSDPWQELLQIGQTKRYDGFT